MEVVSSSHARRADVVATFGDEPSADESGMRRLRVRRRTGKSDIRGPQVDFKVESPIHAASRILSRSFAMRVAMLTGDADTFGAIARAIKAARLNVSIMIEGETGTGKGTLAQLIHAASGRSGDLVAINCSMLGDGSQCDLLLPTRRECAAADARDADLEGPTVFLDNVHELPRAMQHRLLAEMRLQEKGGGSLPRYVASSGRSLGGRTDGGVFDPEFHAMFDRMRVVLPPLRDRPGDIPLLAREFLATCDTRLRFAPDALQVLAEYPFPGNVREMKNLVRRLAIVRPGACGTIEGSDVRTQIIVAALQKTERARPTWRAALYAARREVALRTVSALGGDVDAAAQQLGLSAASLRRSMRLVAVVPVSER